LRLWLLKAVVIVNVGGMLLFTDVSKGQIPSTQGSLKEGLRSVSGETQIPGALMPTTTIIKARALEAPIDPETYILGPGDFLGIAFRGGSEGFYQEQLTPEGNLIVPLAPMLKLSGLTLSAAIDTIHARWLPLFPATEIDISLIGIRTFLVTVTGAVVKPGIYEVSPADRTSTLIELAGGLLTESFWRNIYKSELASASRTFADLRTQLNLRLASRNCVIVRREGETIAVDPLKFERGIEEAINPTLQQGDKLIVGFQSDNSPTIEIAGAVPLPGCYEWRRGDRIRDLIAVAGGFLPDAKLKEVQLTHFNEQGLRESIEVNLQNSVASDTVTNRLLEAGDLIFIRFSHEKPQRIAVTVEGEVRYPGTYPAVEHATRLSDIIAMAGGFTEEAFLRGARVKRELDKDGFLEIERSPEVYRSTTYRSSVSEQFKLFSNRWENHNLLAVDFVELFEKHNASYDYLVEDKDVIQIPNRKSHVLVMGMVKTPGLYPYIEGWNYKDYIRTAGGLATNARPGMIRLVSYESTVWRKPSASSVIGPGDLIFVPEAPERFGWNTFKDVFMVASQAATVLIVILNFIK